MGGLSDFERGQIVGARLAGAYVIRTAILLGVSIPTVSKVMSAYTYHEKTTSAKRNSGRKSTLTEIDRRAMRRIVSKNHRITAAQVTTEVNIHLEDSVYTKTVRRVLHKSNAHGSGMAAIAKPLITESNAQMCKR
jgi:transposase